MKKKSRPGTGNRPPEESPADSAADRWSSAPFPWQPEAALDWARESGWPGGRIDVRTAAQLYRALPAGDREGERWRLVLCQALCVAFVRRYGDATVGHRITLCATLIEERHRRGKAGGL